MKVQVCCVALLLSAGAVRADIVDDFESYEIGSAPGGVWQDAAAFISDPTNPAPTVTMISTQDAHGAATRAVQITDALGTSGGIAAEIEHQRVQRFETDLRFDQASDGNYPNWIAAAGFFQVTDQADLITMPQALIYSLNSSRQFRLYVHNADGRRGRTLDVSLGSATWEFDRWYRVVFEVDTELGSFSSTIVDIESGETLIESTRTMANWNAEFGQFDLVSVNDGEYGTNAGTRGNMVSIDNAKYTPAPGTVGVMGCAGLLGMRRRR